LGGYDDNVLKHNKELKQTIHIHPVFGQHLFTYDIAIYSSANCDTVKSFFSLD